MSVGFLLVVCRPTLAPNGLGICDGAVIAFRQPSFALKLHRITEVEHLTSSRTIANTMLAAVIYLSPNFSILFPIVICFISVSNAEKSAC